MADRQATGTQTARVGLPGPSSSLTGLPLDYGVPSQYNKGSQILPGWGRQIVFTGDYINRHAFQKEPALEATRYSAKPVVSTPDGLKDRREANGCFAP